MLNPALTQTRENIAMNPSGSLANSYYLDGLKLSAGGKHHDAIGRYEQALAASPNDVRVLFALGNTARSLGLAKPAEDFFRRVLALDPGRLEALINFGNLLRAEGAPESAIALLTPALSRNPESPELLLTLGSAHRERGDIELAEDLYRKALSHRIDYAEALGNLADLLADRGLIDEALTLYDRAIKRDGSNSQARLNRAILYLLRGNLKEGWRDYAARLKIPGKVPAAGHRIPRWTGESLKHKRLLVTCEQGIGDQIMFASIFADLIARAAAEGGSIVLECEPRLVALFTRSFPGATVHATDLQSTGPMPQASYGWLKPVGGANAAIEMGSLPRILRGSIDLFANPHSYLVADPAEVARWQSFFGEMGAAPRIGVCWRSGKTAGLRGLQYAPLATWADLLSRLPGTLVCAQYDAEASEVTELELLSGRKLAVPHNVNQKNEIDRTGAMLSTLDAVISAPTAVSWLAAATGVPTFKALRDTSWTSFGQTYEPFAPSCICIGAEKSGDWESVFDRIACEVSLRFSVSSV